VPLPENVPTFVFAKFVFAHISNDVSAPESLAGLFMLMTVYVARPTLELLFVAALPISIAAITSPPWLFEYQRS